jgi:hypothetical protein
MLFLKTTSYTEYMAKNDWIQNTVNDELKKRIWEDENMV